MLIWPLFLSPLPPFFFFCISFLTFIGLSNTGFLHSSLFPKLIASNECLEELCSAPGPLCCDARGKYQTNPPPPQKQIREIRNGWITTQAFSTLVKADAHKHILSASLSHFKLVLLLPSLSPFSSSSDSLCNEPLSQFRWCLQAFWCISERTDSVIQIKWLLAAHTVYVLTSTSRQQLVLTTSKASYSQC